ncbi:MAG: YfiR family protein [Terracidiphilus sp.]
MSPASLCHAQSKAEFTPYDVEAAYLYNFGKFIQWPSAPGASFQPFSICILGQDNFGKQLDDIVAGESIQGRKIVAIRLPSAEAADQCQIVFLGSSEDTRLARDLDVLGKKPVLTVSSIPMFLERGGMIQFLIQNNRVRFAVNLPAARQAGLELSSQLLKVAEHVTTNPPQEDVN